MVRVGIAYAVIGWFVAQIAEFAFENFGAPDWVLKTVVVLLLLGLPIAQAKEEIKARSQARFEDEQAAYEDKLAKREARASRCGCRDPSDC